jgi:hypothetical protein
MKPDFSPFGFIDTNNLSGSLQAENFAAFAFGRFALFLNEWIAEEESGARPKSDITLKNAYHLQANWKQLKKDGKCVATLLPEVCSYFASSP